MGGGASLQQIPETLMESTAGLRLSEKLLRSHENTSQMLASLRRRSVTDSERRQSFSGVGGSGKRRASRSTLPRIAELPSSATRLLTKVGIDEQLVTAGGGPSALVSHVFECLSALQHVIRYSQDGLQQTAGGSKSSYNGDVDETQSNNLGKNAKSVGKLLHEIVTLYGICGDTVRVLVNAEPFSAAVEDSFGRLPLHVAVDRDKPWMLTIEDLVDAYPEALLCRDGSGRMPLHIAVDRQEPCLEVVRFLVEANRETAGARRGVGRLPIHYSLFPESPSPEVVSLLMEAYPDGVKTADVYGRLPLHYAVEKQRPQDETVLMLLKAFPDGAAVRDSYARLPLSLISEYAVRVSFCVVKALFEAHPEAVRTPTNGGKLPLHLAFEHASPNLQLVGFLAASFPEAILMLPQTDCSFSLASVSSSNSLALRPPVGARGGEGVANESAVSTAPAPASASASAAASAAGAAVAGASSNTGTNNPGTTSATATAPAWENRRKECTPLETALAHRNPWLARELLLVIPKHDPIRLRELHWRARRGAFLLAKQAVARRDREGERADAGSEGDGGEGCSGRHSPITKPPSSATPSPFPSPRRGSRPGATTTSPQEQLAPAYIIQLQAQHVLVSAGLRRERPASSILSGHDGRSDAGDTEALNDLDFGRPPLNVFKLLHDRCPDAFRVVVGFL